MVNFVQKCSFPVNFTPRAGQLLRDGRAISLPSVEIDSLHYHNLCEVGICRCGEGLWLVGDNVTVIKPGDAMLVLPGVCHYSRAVTKVCRCEFVYFDADDLMRSNGINLALHLTSGIQPVFRGEEAELLKMMVETRDPVESALWFALFLKRLPQRETDALPTARKLSPALQRIMLSYAEELSVDELAEECGFSKSWFIKEFKREYGMTPIGFLNDFRVRVAAELLGSELSVTEIASRSGFSSPSDLYRHFIKKYGCPPSEYRKECRK